MLSHIVGSIRRSNLFRKSLFNLLFLS